MQHILLNSDINQSDSAESEGFPPILATLLPRLREASTNECPDLPYFQLDTSSRVPSATVDQPIQVEPHHPEVFLADLPYFEIRRPIKTTLPKEKRPIVYVCAHTGEKVDSSLIGHHIRDGYNRIDSKPKPVLLITEDYFYKRKYWYVDTLEPIDIRENWLIMFSKGHLRLEGRIVASDSHLVFREGEKAGQLVPYDAEMPIKKKGAQYVDNMRVTSFSRYVTSQEKRPPRRENHKRKYQPILPALSPASFFYKPGDLQYQPAPIQEQNSSMPHLPGLSGSG
jgi:hypothetical protein